MVITERAYGGVEDKHEKPTLGELNTIAGGFSGGGSSSAKRKRYARLVMMLAEEDMQMPSLSFMEEDLRDVFSHDNDLVVILIVMKNRWVHRVLVDQGSSIDIIFLGNICGHGRLSR